MGSIISFTICSGLSLVVVSDKGCWGEGFSAEYCCRGLKGRAECWDSLHNFETCCLEYKNSTYPFVDLLWGRREAGAIDPRRYPPRGPIAEAHLACILEMQRLGHWEARECSRFQNLVDRAVEHGTPGSDTRAQYLGTHYRLLLRSLPYTSFASPVFDAFYKARSFPNEFWGRDDFALFEAAFRAILAPGHVAVDGGANIGGYTQMMALAVGSSGEVHSFEPFRITFQFLNANVVLGGLQNVWTYNKALSNRDGAKTEAYGTDIQDPAQQMIWNSLVIPREAHWEFGPAGMWLAEPSELEKLEHIRLDSCRLSRLDFIKSDVEGMEGHLFLGGLTTIQTYWPSILVEIKEFQRQAIHSFLVTELGYSCHSALTTNPSDFFCWHPHRARTMPGEAKRIQETLEILTTERAFEYCEACQKRTPAPVELGQGHKSAKPARPENDKDRQQPLPSMQTSTATISATTPGATTSMLETAFTTTTTSSMSASFSTTASTTSSPVTIPVCRDDNAFCTDWAKNGECASNPRYMNVKCRRSCGKC